MGLFSRILNNVPRPLLIKLSYWVQPISDLYFRGTKYTDPINEKSYRKFLPYGYENLRPNALAPGTLSLERHRLLWLYLKNSNFFNQESKVLHIAPEQCFIKRFKKLKNLDYTTTDLYSPIVDIKADICDLPFEDNSFDWVLCNHVLEHIQDDRQAMREIFRILKPGGSAILQIPMDYDLDKTYEDDRISSREERAKHFGQYDHVRLYGWDYYDRLASIGFEVYKEQPQTKLSEKQIEQYALAVNEVIPVVKKPHSQF
ncbi:class I SAM-dependent methyltransferase [Flavobacteriaceae bacterium]|nr:class I SAM-dependent methyltransferase [Flavobacteriaceae bacterium]